MIDIPKHRVIGHRIAQENTTRTIEAETNNAILIRWFLALCDKRDGQCSMTRLGSQLQLMQTFIASPRPTPHLGHG